MAVRSDQTIHVIPQLVKTSTAGLLQTLNSIFSSPPVSLTSSGQSDLVAARPSPRANQRCTRARGVGMTLLAGTASIRPRVAWRRPLGGGRERGPGTGGGQAYASGSGRGGIAWARAPGAGRGRGVGSNAAKYAWPVPASGEGGCAFSQGRAEFVGICW